MTEEQKAAHRVRTRSWYRRNKAKHRALVAAWNARNPEKGAEYSRKYRDRNQEKVLARGRAFDRARQPERSKYVRKRAKLDIGFRLCRILRTRLYSAVKGTRKSARTLDLLGCKIPELLTHLESKFQPGMTWENYGPVWHVDHKRPCASFDLTKAAQQRACFHWTNLQPLYATENMKKGARVSLCEI